MRARGLSRRVFPQASSPSIIDSILLYITKKYNELKIFIILGTYESNPSENKISNISPVGKQLLGKCVGDEIDFIINETSFSYEIISVEKYMHLS